MSTSIVANAGVLLAQSGTRASAAYDALRGGPVGPPPAVRRWPWAALAAVLGALAGAAVVLVARRVVGADAPGSQEPEQLRAVVDRGPAAQPADRGPARD